MNYHVWAAKNSIASSHRASTAGTLRLAPPGTILGTSLAGTAQRYSHQHVHYCRQFFTTLARSWRWGGPSWPVVGSSTVVHRQGTARAWRSGYSFDYYANVGCSSANSLSCNCVSASLGSLDFSFYPPFVNLASVGTQVHLLERRVGGLVWLCHPFVPQGVLAIPMSNTAEADGLGTISGWLAAFNGDLSARVVQRISNISWMNTLEPS